MTRAERIEYAARSLIDREDFWRNAGTLPGEYDNLLDALAAPVEAHGERRVVCGVCYRPKDEGHRCPPMVLDDEPVREPPPPLAPKCGEENEP